MKFWLLFAMIIVGGAMVFGTPMCLVFFPLPEKVYVGIAACGLVLFVIGVCLSSYYYPGGIPRHALK